MTTGTLVLIILAVLLFIRFRKALRTWLLSAAGGVAALGLVNLTAGLTGILLPMNLFTLLVCLVLGLPGTVGMLFLNLFW